MTKENIDKIIKEDGSEISIFGDCILTEFPKDEFRPPILYLQGSPFELGYARIVLSAHIINDLLHLELCPMYALVGGWNPLVRGLPTIEHMEKGRDKL